MRGFVVVLFACAFALVPAASAGAIGLPTHGPDLAPAPLPFAAAAAEDWCGPALTSDDTVDQVDNGPYRYHALYALPVDAPDRFKSYASAIQQGALGASALLERLYGRAIRFDMGTACGPQYLDITTVRLPQTAAQLRQLASQDQTFDTIVSDLRSSVGPQLTTNWVVWLDAAGPFGACGEGTALHDRVRSADNESNDGGQVAIVFNRSGVFCGADAVRHEIGHTLGAVQPDAPHAFDGFHCNDNLDDTMCSFPAQPIGDQFFDYRNDDYWDPPGGKPLPWWTVNLNRFLCPDANCNRPPGAAAPAKPAVHHRTTRRCRQKTRRARRLCRRRARSR